MEGFFTRARIAPSQTATAIRGPTHSGVTTYSSDSFDSFDSWSKHDFYA
jgi:hypothetical protein